MDERLLRIETPYIDAQALLGIFQDYEQPRSRIFWLVKKGELIRLKNGFYLIRAKIEQKGQTIIPFEQVANLLYGPSYVSLEWALSFHGMIPERVHAVTSMTLGRDKKYITPIGNFLYHKSKTSSHAIGIEQQKAIGSIGSFLIATPEKALADLVFKRCKTLSKVQIREELIESRRIDVEHFSRLDKKLLEEIAEGYRSSVVDNFVNLIGTL
jgi:predicted transcriptional regulator of viral defense system